MEFSGQSFEISIDSQPVQVDIYLSGKVKVYKVRLISGPFFLTKTKDADRYDFWTSIPQGKQKLAEDIGEIIDRTLNNAEPDKSRNSNNQPTLF